jgi:threonine dehydrogenase-like Zn-dependent dehydrogenase
MKAVVCQNSKLELVERPEPSLAAGQVRLKVLRCGICGSDLHARHGVDAWADMSAKAGYDRFGRSHEEIVFGHEFSGEIAEYGPNCRRKLKTGTQVVALPLLRGSNGVDALGFSASAPGAYAEQTVVNETLMMPIPNGLDPDVAALTEPMTVAWHAVRRGDVNKKTVAIVIGCGPVGLGVILMLRAKGVETIVASDYSPGRRALAKDCGATVVVDPKEGSPFTVKKQGQLTKMSTALNLAVGTLEKLSTLPIGWWHVFRVARAMGSGPKFPVIFECVGAPGLIDDVIQNAPLFSRIVAVGMGVGVDRFTPFAAAKKEIDLRFVGTYTPLEFRETLHMLADGKVDPRPMITGTVGLEGVEDAFAALRDPEAHAKILIDPFAAQLKLAVA